MKTTIIFLRHGEVDNRKGILYGRLPKFKLSQAGREKIQAVSRELKSKYIISKIYTSPMLRAKQTAEIIAKNFNLKPKISQLIIEVKLIFEGISVQEYKEKIQYRLYSKDYVKRGQESIKEIADRMLKFVDIIRKRHPGEAILVVSHGDPIMILKAVTSDILFTWEYKKNNYLKTGEKVILEINKNDLRWR